MNIKFRVSRILLTRDRPECEQSKDAATTRIIYVAAVGNSLFECDQKCSFYEFDDGKLYVQRHSSRVRSRRNKTPYGLSDKTSADDIA